MESKRCTWCNEVKPLTAYCLDKRRGKRECACRVCRDQRARERFKALPPEKKEAVLQRERDAKNKANAKNRDLVNQKSRETKIRNKAAVSKQQKDYYQRNRDEICKRHNERFKKYVDDLGLKYVIYLLGAEKLKNVPAELIEAKRTQLRLHRAITKPRTSRHLNKGRA